MERKLAKQDERWFTLGHRRAENGQPAVRIWTIECHKCGRMHSLTPGSSSEEAIRKGLIRGGWDLGRRANRHLCPECTGAVKKLPVALPAVTPVTSATPVTHVYTPSPAVISRAELDAVAKARSEVLSPIPEKQDKPFLMEAWGTCSGTEQDDFLNWLAVNVPGALLRFQIQPRQPRLSLRDYWDAMPEVDRERWLDRRRPRPTLRQLWADSSLDDCTEFMHWLWGQIGHNLVKWVSLIRIWSLATDQQRQDFLGYLREAGLMTVTVVAPAAPTVKIVGRPSNNIVNITPTNTRPVIEPGTISKSEFARELGITPATVSGYLNKGMPDRPDGRLDAEVVRDWVKNNINQAHRHRPKQLDISGDTLAFDDDDAIAALSKKLFG